MAKAAAKQDAAAALAECLAPLAGEAFPVATWDEAAVLQHCFIAPSRFIKAVNYLTRESDEIFFRRLILRGGSGEWWEAPATCTPVQMYDFCMWLRSPEGAAYIDEQRRLRRLEKKAYSWQTPEDACYVRAMEAQLAEVSAAVKAAQSRFQSHLRGEKEEREMEAAIRAIEADYTPASAYAPMNETEMGEKCYEVYKGECERQGKKAAAPPLSDEFARDLRGVYGNEAAAMHRTEYMREGRRREEVRVWLEDKIAEFERVYDVRKAKSFRFYLKTVGGEVAPEVRAEVEGRAMAAGSRRKTRRRFREEEVEAADVRNTTPVPRRQRVEVAGAAYESKRNPDGQR